jgi:hypothetical protein
MPKKGMGVSALCLATAECGYSFTFPKTFLIFSIVGEAMVGSPGPLLTNTPSKEPEKINFKKGKNESRNINQEMDYQHNHQYSHCTAELSSSHLSLRIRE